MRLLFLCIFFFMGTQKGKAQYSRYIIQLKDKGNNSCNFQNPLQFLSQRALNRRNRYQISIDSFDLPVTRAYVDSIQAAGNVTILNTSKWLNQVAIQTNDSLALIKINQLPFVQSALTIGARGNVPIYKFPEILESTEIPRIQEDYRYGRAAAQIKIHQGDFLHRQHFSGEGMQLAMMDAGFYRYLTLPTFDSIRANQQIIETWDYVRNESSVNEDHWHGMSCLSTIAANIPGTFVGTAPKTSFYLYRTEDVATEFPIEEQNWAAAAERADSAGADIISSSLGYNSFSDASFDYTYADMNGKTSIIAKAATKAASKGMLVFTSAGNDGQNSWRYICTPADADSVIAVGAVDSLGNVGGFSSYGPSNDGRIKPELAAVGWQAAVANTSTGQPILRDGTSFACPNLAGIGTCLWQAFPELNNMEIKNLLISAASRANIPDDRMGYGIPNAKKAFVHGIKKLFRPSSPYIIDCSVRLNFDIKVNNSMQIDLERKHPEDSNFVVISNFQGSDVFSIMNFQSIDNLDGYLPGIVQYRLKISIAADTVFYIAMNDVNFTEKCKVNDDFAEITPNSPLTPNIPITIGTLRDGKATVLLYDISGKLFQKKEYNQIKGIQHYTINTTPYSKGVYLITVFFENKRLLTQKILR